MRQPPLRRRPAARLRGEGFRPPDGNLLVDDNTSRERPPVECEQALAKEIAVTRATATAEGDAVLARRIAAGDVAIWDRLFDRYSAWAYRFAYHHLGANHADAQDLSSDILMTAAASMGRFDPAQGTLDLWLLGVARHRLARFCRRRRMEVPLIPEFAESAANPEVALSTEEDAALTRQLVNRALASLPQRHAAVLVGKYVTGYTVEELARSTDSTPKAVESLLTRARAAFRAAFTELAGSAAGGDSRG
ncbi:MAG TPA: sigma-70 family RNA polymerase sigma factor [Armatimonadota bacterium]|nr:sigma-70 family RNA polymerase sigma factor [Armatimonadota bacterium]